MIIFKNIRIDDGICNKFDIVKEIVGGAISGDENGPFTFHDGQTPPTEKAIEDKIKEILKDYNLQEYARKRRAEYPDWGTQLNKIYDDGLAKWKSEMVDPIKKKFPKP